MGLNIDPQALNSGLGAMAQFQDIRQGKEKFEFMKQLEQARSEQQMQETKLKLDELKLKMQAAKRQEALQNQYMQAFGIGGQPGGTPMPQGQAPNPLPQGGQPMAQPQAPTTQEAMPQGQAQPDAAKLQRLQRMAALSAMTGTTPAFNTMVDQGIVTTPANSLKMREQADSLLGEQRMREAKGELAEYLGRQADKETGERSSRMRLTSMAISAMKPGQIGAFINKQFPSVQDAKTPFQALLAEGKTAAGAMKIIGDMDTHNKMLIANSKPPPRRNFGALREAEASAMYGGKSFEELEPAQQAEVNDKVYKQKLRLEAAKIEQGPLPVEARKKIAELRSIGGSVKELLKTFRPEFVGKGNFLQNKFQLMAGTADPALTAFTGLYNDTLDKLARERTGAVIGEDEARQFRSILGSLWDEPATIQKRMEQLLHTIVRQEDTVIDLSTMSGAEIRESRSQRRQPKKDTQSFEPSDFKATADDELTKAIAQEEAKKAVGQPAKPQAIAPIPEMSEEDIRAELMKLEGGQ